MKYEDILLEEITKWDTRKFSLIFKKSLVFLCGGFPSKQEDKFGETLHPSLRSYLIDFASIIKKEIEIKTAEDIQDYTTVYDDLVEFESDIASISDLIVIILEGDGALVELGIFIENKNLRNKLVVIQNSGFNDISSFINLGPLKVLEKISKTTVLEYDWPYKKSFEKLEDGVLEMICDDISNHLKSPRTQSTFDINIKSHLILFVYEIIRCFFPITAKEILDILHLLYSETLLSQSKLKKILYLLQKFDLIKIRKISSEQFLYPLDIQISKVKISHNSTSTSRRIFDYSRLRITLIERINQDAKRSIALKGIN